MLPCLRLFAASAVLVCAGAACSVGGHSGGTIRIGVLLPSTDFGQPLEWALENVNRQRVAGKKLELVYVDPGKQGVVAAARTIAADPSIVAVIGPESSEDVFAVANLFIAAKKPLVTPSATAAEIFRAFSSSGYVWRTVQSDVAQTEVMLRTAARRHAKRVALLTSTDLYGSTFFDSFGFYATELGLNVSGIVRYDQRAARCDAYVAKALAGRPDTLIVVPSTTRATVCIARQVRASGSGARVLFSDGGEDAAAVQALGATAGGLEGIAPAAAPGNGFAAAFRTRFGTAPTPYAAQTYDALVLLAYGLQRSDGAGGAALANGIARVVEGRGETTGWDKSGIAEALSAIRAGGRPNVTGATGPLVYERTDPASGFYAHWRVEHDAFATEFVQPGTGTPTASATSSLRHRVAGRRAVAVGPRTGLRAVLIATSFGLDNYRHQADVLAQYQVLRRNRVADDHIVLIMAGDVAVGGGDVPYSVGGPNLDRDVHIDYRLDKVTAAGFLAILGGRRSAAYPQVVDSGPGDDVYVYIAGHGNEHGVYVGVDQPVPVGGGYTVLTPGALTRTVDAMATARRYRRLLIAVEACQGGVLGEPLTAPNAMLLSAASPVEDSLSTNYDAKRGIWLADEFSYALWRAERSSPGESLDALHEQLYLNVAGEHVSAYGPRFGDAAAVSLREFLSP